MNDHATRALPCLRQALSACAERCQGKAHSHRQYGGELLLEGCCRRRCLHDVIGIPSACGFTTATIEACRRDLDKMTRLADYFVVVGYDLDKRGKRGRVSVCVRERHIYYIYTQHTHTAILSTLLPPLDLLCRID